eukprot:TRINITY_DN2517_c0_g1_i5.p2 TRINITY_DN2517_c0_g1~~TRINITY_DN2517_c0_g1_i5.p2  ORF type:complete len:434 (-),score=132.41 TRINITY_DN2517_c0_g1_i5:967-2268(-)
MNLSNRLYTNLKNSTYLKSLNKYHLYSQIIDEIYNTVEYLEPWVPRTEIVSTPYCLMYKLFLMKLTYNQVTSMLDHADSPFIRGIGFMFLRYATPPAELFDWFQPYFEDTAEIWLKADDKESVPMGTFVYRLLFEEKFLGETLPRVPIPVMREMLNKVDEYVKENPHSIIASTHLSVSQYHKARPQAQRPVSSSRSSKPKRKYGRKKSRSRSRSRSRSPYRGSSSSSSSSSSRYHSSHRDRDYDRDRDYRSSKTSSYSSSSSSGLDYGLSSRRDDDRRSTSTSSSRYSRHDRKSDYRSSRSRSRSRERYRKRSRSRSRSGSPKRRTPSPETKKQKTETEGSTTSNTTSSSSSSSSAASSTASTSSVAEPPKPEKTEEQKQKDLEFQRKLMEQYGGSSSSTTTIAPTKDSEEVIRVTTLQHEAIEKFRKMQHGS